MNKCTLSILAFSAVMSLSLHAISKVDLSNKVKMFCEEFLKQLSKIENVSSTMEMRNLVGELDTFVNENASGDKDLLNPWATMKQSMDTMLTYSDIWSKLSRGNFDNATLKSNIEKVYAALDASREALKKLKKTTFFLSKKKDAAAMLKYFGEYEDKIGTKLHGALLYKCNVTFCNK